MPGTSTPAEAREVREVRRIDRATAVALAAMGPSGHHRGPDELEARAEDLPAVMDVTVAVQVHRFRAPGAG